MKVIIAGCRNWKASFNAIQDAVDASGFVVSTVYSGGANGIDLSGKIWADMQGIPTVVVKADWNQYGLSAGPKRNRVMADGADALIALWDGKSKGTLNMINAMRALNKPYFVVPLGNIKLIDSKKTAKNRL